MNCHEFKTDYDFDEFVDAYMLHLGVGRKVLKPWKVFAVLISAAAATSLLLSFGSPEFDFAETIGLMVVAAILGAMIVWLPLGINRPALRRQLAIHWDQMKRAGQETIYRFDDVQLVIEDSAFGGRLNWSDLFAWTENERFLLLYRAPQLYYYIAKPKVGPETLAVLKACVAASPAKVL